MDALRVLITNRALAERAGTELYVRDLATALRDLGHRPIVYSPRPGEVARELREAEVPVADDLARVQGPIDLIHGQHHAEAMGALSRLPGVPAIYVCHGAQSPHEAPPSHPRIRRYVAVDHPCRDRLLDSGVAEERVLVLPNFVDMARFRPRGPLPDLPRRALVLSHRASARTHLDAVRTACAAAGITVDVAGRRSGRVVERPEEILGGYDLVFAKGRAALEALAVGCAVVLCDAAGGGPLVRGADLDRLRDLNFGFRALTAPAAPGALSREIAGYDPADAAEVSRRVRARAGRDRAVDALVALYRDVIAEHERIGPPDPASETKAAADYLRRHGPERAVGAHGAGGAAAGLRRAWKRLVTSPALRRLTGR